MGIDAIKKKIEKLFLAVDSLNWKKKAVFAIVLFFVLAPAVHYHFSFREQAERQETHNDFIKQEKEVNIMYEKLLTGWVDENYADSNKECPEISEYNNLADMDTREMSVEQMERAAELHQGCAYLLPNLINFRMTYLKSEISKLSAIAEKIFSQKGKYALAWEISRYWNKIGDLFEEEYQIFQYNTDIKTSIWDTEIEYALKGINTDSRNIIIKKINRELTKKNNRYSNIQNEKKKAFGKKDEALKMFKSEVGFIEMPSLINLSNI